MCGIIAVVRKPERTHPADPAPTCSPASTERPTPGGRSSARPRRRGVDAGRRAGRGGRPAPARRRPACGPCWPTVRWPPSIDGRRRRRSTRRSSTLEAELDAGRDRRRRCRARGGQRRARPPQGRGAGRSAATASAPPGPSPTWPAPTPAPARRRRLHCRSSWRCRRSTASRCAAATPPASPARARPRPRPRRAAVGRAARRARAATRCSASGAVRHARGPPQLRLQGGGRDRRARRQHPGPARRDPRRRAAAPGPRRPTSAEVTVLGHTRWASVGIISQPNAHPLNSRGAGRRPTARTSSPRSTATSTTSPTSRSADGLRIAAEITTDAKVIPTLVSPPARRGRRPRSRRSARRSRRFEGSVAIARQLGRRPPTGSCSRCGAAARPSTSASPRTLTSSPASPTAWSRRPTATSAWTARRRPTPTTRPPAAARSSCSTRTAAGTLEGIRRFAYDGTELPVTRRRAAVAPEITTRDIDRGDVPHFLLKEISEAPASFRKTLRGKLVERDGAAASLQLGRRRCPPTSARDLRDGAIASVLVDRPGHRRGRRRRAWPCAPRAPATGTDAPGRGACLATELSGFGLRGRHERHARRRHQPVGHHHRHQPHRRPRARRGARRSSPSSTGATATSPTRPTACSTRPTGATSR